MYVTTQCIQKSSCLEGTRNFVVLRIRLRRNINKPQNMEFQKINSWLNSHWNFGEFSSKFIFSVKTDFRPSADFRWNSVAWKCVKILLADTLSPIIL